MDRSFNSQLQCCNPGDGVLPERESDSHDYLPSSLLGISAEDAARPRRGVYCAIRWSEFPCLRPLSLRYASRTTGDGLGCCIYAGYAVTTASDCQVFACIADKTGSLTFYTSTKFASGFFNFIAGTILLYKVWRFGRTPAALRKVLSGYEWHISERYQQAAP